MYNEKYFGVIEDFAVRYGFKVEITPIGDRVFPGYQKWLNAINCNDGSNSICQAYQENLIDYYLINFSKV